MKFYASDEYKSLETIEIAEKEFTDLELTEGTPDLAAGGVIAGVDFAPTATVSGVTVGIIDSTIDLSGIGSGFGFNGVVGNYENITIENAKSGAIYTNDHASSFKDVLFVNNSYSGTGGALHAKSNTTITGGTFLNNTKASHGGAIFTADKKYTLTVEKTLFHGNQAANGGAIRVDNTAVISGATFSANNGTSGGAINVEGTCTVKDNSLFIGNSASGGHGGAIYALGTADLTVSKSYFKSNSASYAGAIKIESGAKVNINGSTFYENTQTGAAAIWNNGGTLTIENTLFYGNSGGSGALLSEGANASLIVSGSTFATTTDRIYNSNQLIFQNENTIGANIYNGTTVLAENSGLRFHNVSDSHIIFSSTELILEGNNYFVFDNTLKTVCFYNDISGASFTVTRNLLENCSSGYLIATDFKNGWNGTITVEGYGDVALGKKFVLGDYEYAFASDNNLTVTKTLRAFDVVYVDTDKNGVSVGGEVITRGVFTSEADAKAALISGGTLFYDGKNNQGLTSPLYHSGNIGYVNSTFSGNQSSTYGSAIQIKSAGSKLILDNVSFLDNSSPQFVGAVWLEAGASAEISNTLFNGNKATGSSNGGALYLDAVEAGTATLSGVTFQSASDTVFAKSALIFKDTNYLNATIFSSNYGKSKLTDGATLVFGNDTEITIYTPMEFTANNGLVFNGTKSVSFNNAVLTDVAITVTADLLDAVNGTFIIANGVTLDNKTITVTSGGDLLGNYALGSSFTYNGSKYTFASDGNLTVTKHKPEVVYVQLNGSGEVVIDGETITANVFDTIEAAREAVASGGSVYVYSLDSSERMVWSSAVNTIIADGKISGNDTQATGNDGGAIFMTSGTLTISGGEFTGNAARYGGAIRLYGGELTINNNALFAENSATHGSAISASAGTLNIDGAVFSGNKKSGAGAVWISGSAVATVRNALFYQNTGSSSGALHLDNSNVSVSGSTFATASDTICFGSNGLTLTFSGANILNASITNAGTLKLMDNAVLRFENSSDIAMSSVNFAFDGDGDDADAVALYGMTFGGSGKVSFKSGTELAGVKITLAGNLPGIEETTVIASNVGTVDLDKVFIGDEAVGTDGVITVNDVNYNVALNGTDLVINREMVKYDTVYAQLDGTGKVEGVEAGIYDTIAKAEKYVENGGTVNILNLQSDSKVTFAPGGYQTLTVFDKANVSGASFDKNGALQLTANSNIAIVNSTFADNTATYEHTSAVSMSGTGTLSVRQSVFTGNSSSTIIGALRFNNAGGGLVENSCFAGNTASGKRNGAAIYVEDNVNVVVSGSTFATASDKIYTRGNLTFAGVNEIGGSICHHYTIAQGVYGSMTLAENAGLKFINSDNIEVNDLTFSSNNTLTFAGSAAVDFWNFNFADKSFDDVDLSGVNITVDTTGFAGGFKTIASGVAKVGSYTAGDYKLSLINNELILHDSVVNDPLAGNGIKGENNGSDLLTTITGEFAKDVYGGSKTGTDGALLIEFNAGKDD